MKFLCPILALAFSLHAGITCAQEAPSLSERVPGIDKLEGEKKAVFEKLLKDFEFKNFDPNQESLPPNFKGNSPLAVAQSLGERFKSKGEFETTADYQKRIRDAKNGDLYGDVKTAGTLSFVAECRATYDADAAAMTLEVPISHNVLPENNSISVGDYRVRGDYDGTNVFGKSVQVRKVSGALVSLNFVNTKEFKIRANKLLGTVENAIVKIPFALEEARVEKQDIRALLVASLSEPYLEDGHQGHSPTIGEPFDIDVNEFFIGARIQEIWFFNVVNGKVYSKLAPKRKGG